MKIASMTIIVDQGGVGIIIESWLLEKNTNIRDILKN